MAGTNVNGDYNTSIGYMANTEVDSSGNVISSIGSHTTAIGAHTIAVAGATAVGDSAKATGENSVAVGYGAKAEGGSAIAIGQTAQASDNSIALGDASFANQSISSGISYLTNVVAGSSGVVSVGSDTVKRRIVNVADGSEGNDAVNVNQLKAAQTKVAEFIGGNVTLAADGSYTSITLKDTSNVEHTYSTLAEAMGAVTTGQIEVATAGVVKYSDANQTNIILGDGTATGGATISKLKDATTADQAVNLGQMNTAIEASRIKYYSVNSTISANRDNSGAAGLNSWLSDRRLRPRESKAFPLVLIPNLKVVTVLLSAMLNPLQLLNKQWLIMNPVSRLAQLPAVEESIPSLLVTMRKQNRKTLI